jgi:hypothetical protein
MKGLHPILYFLTSTTFRIGFDDRINTRFIVGDQSLRRTCRL